MVSPRIIEAIEESTANLPDRVQREITDFAGLVIVGKAPSLEKYTSTLYKAFAPLRKALGGSTTMYRGQPISPPKIKRKWLSWTTNPRLAAQFAGDKDYEIIEAKVKSSDVVAGILSPYNSQYIEFLVKNEPQYQQRSPKQVPLYYALYMESVGWKTPLPPDYHTLSDQEKLDWEYPHWKRWLSTNAKAVERAGGEVIYSDPPKPDDRPPFLGVIMPPDQTLPPALASLDDAKYGRPMPKYMGRVANNTLPIHKDQRIGDPSMSRKLTSSDRKTLIRMASELPKGSDERKAILAGLDKTPATKSAASPKMVVKADRKSIDAAERFGDPEDLGWSQWQSVEDEYPQLNFSPPGGNDWKFDPTPSLCRWVWYGKTNVAFLLEGRARRNYEIKSKFFGEDEVALKLQALVGIKDRFGNKGDGSKTLYEAYDLHESSIEIFGDVHWDTVFVLDIGDYPKMIPYIPEKIMEAIQKTDPDGYIDLMTA